MPTRLDLAGCSCKQFSSRRGHETSIHSHKATESELSPHYAEGEPHIHEARCTVQHYPANNRHTLPYQVLRRSRFLVAHMSTVFIDPRPQHRHPKLRYPFRVGRADVRRTVAHITYHDQALHKNLVCFKLISCQHDLRHHLPSARHARHTTRSTVCCPSAQQQRPTYSTPLRLHSPSTLIKHVRGYSTLTRQLHPTPQ